MIANGELCIGDQDLLLSDDVAKKERRYHNDACKPDPWLDPATIGPG